MTTITAKELRDNLDQIVKRVRGGEPIRVTYRSKIAFVIQPDDSKNAFFEPGSQSAMKAYVRQVQRINKIPRKSELDPNKSIKDIYHHLLDNDSKYNGIYER